MEKLAKKNALVITNSNKGEAVAIMDIGNYIEEVNWQLSEKASYKQLIKYPKSQHSSMVNHSIEGFKNEKLLPKKAVHVLRISNLNTKILHFTKNLQVK